ncbi:MAG: hypothetical protein IID46_11505, partial [Planctomycetes bacterium]|nr:hypothetical protein [Planctomycetota bacterium]
AEKGGLFTQIGDKLLRVAVGIEDAITEATGSRFLGKVVTGVVGFLADAANSRERDAQADTINRAQQRLELRPQIIAQQIQFENRKQRLFELRHGKEIDVIRRQLDLEKQKIANIDAMKRALEKQVGGTLAQFNQVDQQGILDLVKRFKKGGAGAIGQKGVDFLKGTPFGQELFQQNAQKFVNKNVLSELTTLLNAGRNTERKQAESEIKKLENVKIGMDGLTINKIELKFENFEQVVHDLELRLETLLRDRDQIIVNRLEAKLKSLIGQQNHNNNATP